MKIAIIGAGNVGAMAASRVIDANLADVILMDIVPGLAKAKALDISDARPISNSTVNIHGTEDFLDISNVDLVAITAGLARKPGMSRDDLLKKNSEILNNICAHIKKYCPDSIVIVVTNPLDIMSYLVMKATGFNPRKVIGMAGVLDVARFINIASSKSKNIKASEILIMGSHGDTMVPINRSEVLSKDIFNEVSLLTRNRGMEIVKYLGSGSAYFAPSMAVFFMIKAVLKNEKKTLCASAYLDGQYGERDIYTGVPIILDSSGVREIIEIGLSEEEKQLFKKSAQEIRENIRKLYGKI